MPLQYSTGFCRASEMVENWAQFPRLIVGGLSNAGDVNQRVIPILFLNRLRVEEDFIRGELAGNRDPLSAVVAAPVKVADTNYASAHDACLDYVWNQIYTMAADISKPTRHDGPFNEDWFPFSDVDEDFDWCQVEAIFRESADRLLRGFDESRMISLIRQERGRVRAQFDQSQMRPEIVTDARLEMEAFQQQILKLQGTAPPAPSPSDADKLECDKRNVNKLLDMGCSSLLADVTPRKSHQPFDNSEEQEPVAAAHNAQETTKRSVAEREAEAIVLLMTKPEMTVKKIAETVGINRSQLSALPKFSAAMKVKKSALSEIPRGTKSGDGTIEAVLEDD